MRSEWPKKCGNGRHPCCVVNTYTTQSSHQKLLQKMQFKHLKLQPHEAKENLEFTGKRKKMEQATVEVDNFNNRNFCWYHPEKISSFSELCPEI
jgi:hypothetical protein